MKYECKKNEREAKYASVRDNDSRKKPRQRDGIS